MIQPRYRLPYDHPLYRHNLFPQPLPISREACPNIDHLPTYLPISHVPCPISHIPSPKSQIPINPPPYQKARTLLHINRTLSEPVNPPLMNSQPQLHNPTLSPQSSLRIQTPIQLPLPSLPPSDVKIQTSIQPPYPKTNQPTKPHLPFHL